MSASAAPSAIQITKRNGNKEPLDINKLHKVVQRACEGLSGVSASEVELKSQLQFFSGMKSTDIQETLIKAAADLISEDAPNYQYVAGRLIVYHLRKEVYGTYHPPVMLDHIKRVVELGYYTPELLQWYSEDEINILNNEIEHDKDRDLTYAAMEQFRGKYLVKNRVTGEIFETPQFLYMLVSMTLFNAEDKKVRLKRVKDYYRLLSDQWLSIPTPILAGVRTPQKQFSSCVLIDSYDSLNSICASSNSIVQYVSKKAGIGVNVGRIRAKGSPVRAGDTSHTGIIPFLKLLRAAVKSCSQGGVRGGAATFYFPIWHLEFEDMVVLKNNKGTDETRIRDIDYGVQLNKLFYERLIKGQDITLFCPNENPEMYDAFFADQDKFKELYEKAEKKKGVRKKVLSAKDVFGILMKERMDTGRIYILNVDNANQQGPFLPDVAPIRMSNLCAEIALPTVPMAQDDSLIALCTLSAINWGKINDPKDFEKVCEYAVRSLNNLLDYQEYPMAEAEAHTLLYRPLGVGITNLAFWIAKNDLTYEGSQDTFDTLDEYMEAMNYYLTKASVQVAKEKNGCIEGFKNTRYSEGQFPWENYKKAVDALTTRAPSLDWESLREEVKTHGIGNATLMAMMPCESSSAVLGATNGIEPPRALVSVKKSKEGSLVQIVPGYPRLKNKYQTLWDIPNPDGYLKICAIIQKWTDQAISVNTSYNPVFYGGKIPMSALQKDLLQHYKLGGKTLYYQNTNDDAGEIDLDKLDAKVVELPKSSKGNSDNDCEDGVCKL